MVEDRNVGFSLHDVVEEDGSEGFSPHEVVGEVELWDSHLPT